MQSSLESIGLGIVTKEVDREDTIGAIEVHIPSLTPGLKDQEVVGAKDSYKNEFKDTEGILAGGTVDRTQVFKAIWYKLAIPNRITAPNLVVGEVIELYRIRGKEEIYWISANAISPHRKFEKITYIFSSKEKHDDLLDLDKAVVLDLDTKKRIISIKTPKNRKEPVKFDLTLNYGEGHVYIETDDDKLFKFDPANDLCTLKIPKYLIDADETEITGELLVHKKTTLEDILKVTKTIDAGDNISSEKDIKAGKDVKAGGKVKQGSPKVIAGHPGHTH